MADKGAALNRRVWQLFSRLGFDTKPNFNDPTELRIDLSHGKHRTVDLLAVDSHLGIRIIGWNKARVELNESITTHLHDYVSLRSRANAQGLLFVATELDLQDADRQYAESQGACIWSGDDLSYYEALQQAIGEFAKYEVIHALGISTKEERRTFTALALRVRQPLADAGTDLFLFTAPPAFLLRTCVVLRKASGSKDAYQRVVQRKRLSKIREFVTTANALLPPNIVVHFGPKVSWSSVKSPDKDVEGKPINVSRPGDYELVSLNLPSEYASIEVIDGQHRLYGFADAEPATQKSFNLLIAGIAGLDTKRKTDTFISINDNARRMDPNLVFYLKYDPTEAVCQASPELMAIKIAVELNKTTPLKKKIRVLDVGTQYITLKGLAGYDLRGLVGTHGRLRKFYLHNSAEYVRALRTYFGILRSTFRKQWDAPERYIVFTNRGVSAFLKLLRSMLRTKKAALTESDFKHYLAPLRKWSTTRWETSRLKGKYVGSGGWKDFHREMVKSIRAQVPEFRE